MSTCGISQLYSSSCPSSCPFWAPSVIWRSVGVCTTEDECITYNPTLGFADHDLKMCLPCKIFGCVKCIQSSVSSCSKRDSDTPPRNNYGLNFNWLPLSDTTFGSSLCSGEGECDQYCLECAKGFNRSEDGKMCYLVSSKIWNISLFITSIAIFIVAVVLSIRVMLNPKQLEVNLKTLRLGIEQRESSLLHHPSTESLYDLRTDLASTNVSGLGLMLYFRFLTFLIFVILILLTVNITHSPLACSKMIRVFGEGYGEENVHSALGTHSASILSLFINDSSLLSAEEPLLDLKTVDQAIAWNASEYARGMANNNMIVYFLLMALTLVYIVSQRKFIQTQANNLQVKNFTLIFKNLYNTTEDDLKHLILKKNGIKPHSITQCYNFRQHTKLVHEILEITKNKDHYVNIDRLPLMDSVLNSVSSTGQFFVTFRTIEDKIVLMNSRDSYAGTSISECTVDPDKVIWENIGLESGLRRRMLLVPLMIILLIVFWSLIFFVPYALYTLHASMSHLMEIIVLGLYVEFGNSLVSVVLSRAVRDMGFVDRDAMDGFIMWSNYIIKLVNIGLNVLLAHFNNYGKSSKVRVMVENMNLYYSSASYKTGEEISFSNSFGMYLMDILILPNLVFIFTYYILPLLNSFCILTLDFNLNETVAVLEFPIVDLAKKYGDSLVNFTVFLLLLFLIKEKRQSLYVSLTLLISYITHYFQCKFVILRKSSAGHYPTWHLEHAALIIWGFPTMILAVLPSYWTWRYKGGAWSLLKINSSAIFHLIFYNIFIHFTFGTYTALKRNDDEITKIRYKAGTYNIDNVDAIEANAAVESKSYTDFNPICNMKELKKLNLF